MAASRFVQPMAFTGSYPNNWAGYVFKEALGYTSGRHTGVDFNFGNGNEDIGYRVYSISEGIVRYAGNPGVSGFGNVVIVEHPLHPQLQAELGTPALFSRYLHLNSIIVSAGQTLGVGQQIATCGNTGTQWAHLHIDLYKANLGVHFQYHKDTELASYLDAYHFIENHKTELGGEMANREQVNNIYKGILHRNGDDGGLNVYTGKDANYVVSEMLNSQERKNLEAHYSNLERKIHEMTVLINDLSKRPTEYEYARIVAQIDDRTKDLEATRKALAEEQKKVKIEYTHDQETKDNVNQILKLVTTIFEYFRGQYKTFAKYIKKEQ